MRRLFLHIGVPKTATTSLQAWLHAQNLELLKNGALYPRSCLWNDKSHHSLFFALRNSGLNLRLQNQGEDIISQLACEIHESSSEECIISSELFANYRNKDHLSHLVSALDLQNVEIFLLIGLRNLERLYISNYFQRVTDPAISMAVSVHQWIIQRKVLAEIESALLWQNFLGSVGAKRLWTRYEVQSDENPVPFLGFFARRYKLKRTNKVIQNLSMPLMKLLVLKHLNLHEKLSLEHKQLFRHPKTLLLMDDLLVSTGLGQAISSQKAGLTSTESRLCAAQLQESFASSVLSVLLSRKQYAEISRRKACALGIDDIYQSTYKEIQWVADEIIAKIQNIASLKRLLMGQ